MPITLLSQLREKNLHLKNPIESGTNVMHIFRHWMNTLHLSPSLVAAFVSTIAFYIILTKRKRSKEKLSENSANSDLNENDNTKRACNTSSDPYDEDRSFQHDIIGPNGPQEIKFVVSTPPSELVPLLHSGMKHASIRRQLVFNLQKMTWERRQPVKMYQDKSEEFSESYHGIADKKKDEDTNENETWQRVDNALPIESLLNVDCNSINLGTIEITFDKSIVPDQGKALIDEDSLLNQVTPETWKRDNTGAGEIALDFSSIDCENDDVDDQSLLESVSVGTQLLNVRMDNERNKASKQHKKKDTGGILNNIKGKTVKGKKEYTFKTELEAAMFQTIFLGMRVAGREIQHMFCALEDINRASDAYNRDSGFGGIALDDVRRCLSDLPTIDENIRHIIRCNYENHSESSHDDHILSGEDENVEIHEMYLSRRLVIGLVDFFWLFLPKVLKGTPYSSPMATKEQGFGMTVGGIDEHQARVRQLIKLRKLIAAASLRVSSYVEAMRVVQSGWQHHAFSNTHIKRRLAFDRRIDNENYDCLHFHEYYEPLLLSDAHEAQTSYGQAFLLVGCKAVHFKASDASEFSLSNPADIPSIRDILEKNRNSEFLIFSVDSDHSSMIMIFIKWLPEGIDTEFDSRYYKFLRNELKRDEIISLHLHSAGSCNIFANFIDSLTGRKDSSLTKKMVEVINIGNRSKTKYFGQGDLDDDDDPSNYIAVKYKIQVDIFSDSWKKSIGNIIPEYGSGRTTDLVFQFDSLNTRPLAAIRLVNVDHNVPSADSLYTIAESEYFPAMDTLLRPVMSMDSDFINDGESYKKDIDSLKDILGMITVPVRQVNKRILAENNEDFKQETIIDGKVLDFFTDKEMLRHFQAAGENIKEAAIRITKAAAFKGLYFPIDTRSCQVELNSGQCFHLGFDKSDSPVFYFRNMCKGLWRKDIPASVAATIFNIDTAFEKLNQTNPDFKVTLVVLMGNNQKLNSKDSSKSTSNTSKRSSEESHNEEISAQKTVMDQEYVHTNFQYVQKLIRITSENYPERLGKALVVPTTGWEKLVGVHGLRRYISSQETRNKVKILDNVSQLKEYVSSDQLADFAGGELKTKYT